MIDPGRELVSRALRRRYREVERFDTGERDERRARSLLRPKGDVVVYTKRPPRGASRRGPRPTGE